MSGSAPAPPATRPPGMRTSTTDPRRSRPGARGALARTARSRSPRRSAWASATLSPAVRDGEVIDAGPGVVERVLRAHDRRRPRAAARQRPRRAGAHPPRRLLGPAHAHWRPSRPRSCSRRWGRPTCAAAAARASRPGRSGASRARAEGATKFIVANGDEGDPGSYIDKVLMEGNPELLIEGLALAGYAVGAEHGFVLVRSEYPLSKPALDDAIARAHEQGLLGDDILGSGFSFDVTIHRGCRLLRRRGGDGPAELPAGAARRGLRPPAVPRPARRARHADGGQQRRDALQHRLHRLRAAPTRTRGSARRVRRRAPRWSASTSASCTPASTRCRSG